MTYRPAGTVVVRLRRVVAGVLAAGAVCLLMVDPAAADVRRGSDPARVREVTPPSWTGHRPKVAVPARIWARGQRCPADTVSLSVAPDGSAIALSYESLLVAAGPNEPSTWAAITCTVRVPVFVPAGMSVRLVDVTHRGTSLGLEPGDGAVAVHTAWYRANGRPLRVDGRSGRRVTPDGPSGDWQITHGLSGARLDRGCRAATFTLDLSTVLTLRSRRVDAVVAEDTTDVGSTLLELEQRPCTAAG